MTEITFVDISKVDENIRLKLREWRNADHVRLNMINQHVITYGEHKEWLKKILDKPQSNYWLVFNENIPIGTIYLENIDLDNGVTEWGYYIGERNYLGKGIGKKILLIFLEKVFEEMCFKRLNTKVLKKNDKALKIYKAIGFKLEKEREYIILMSFDLEGWQLLKDKIST